MQGSHQPKNREKILYIVTKGNFGGAQIYVYSLSTNLPKEKFEAIVVCGEGKTLKQKLDKENIRTYEILNLKRNISIVNELRSFIEIFKIIKKEKPDVLHLNSPKAGGIGGMAGRLLGIKKIIYTAHGWTFNENRSFFSKILIWKLSTLIVWLSHKTIVIAEKEKRQALKMPFVSDKKIELIHNGIEKINFKERELAQKELIENCKLKIENSPVWIGTISELHKNKGLNYIITALSKIEKPFVFLIIGEGEERENIEKMIRENHLEEKVFLLGSIDNASVFLKALDIFTLTSVKEGLPYSILEAGLADLPVVASNIGGIPDIIDSENGILVSKGNVKEIQNSIEKLIDNPDLRGRLGENLKNKVERDFSFEKMVEKTTDLYS